MALRMGALRSALMDADASEEMAGHENRHAKIESDLTVVKWMLGVPMAGVASLVLKAFA